MSRRWTGWIAVGLVACSKPNGGNDAAASADAAPPAATSAATSALPSAPASPSASASASRSTSGPADCSGLSSPPALANIPCIDGFERIRDRTMGFSKDGRYLGYCITSCDTCPKRCVFEDSHARGAKKIFTAASAQAEPDFRAGKLEGDALDKRLADKDRPMRTFLDEQGFRPITSRVRTLSSPWPLPDLVLAVRRINDDLKATQGIEVGAAVAGGEPVYVMRIDLGPHPQWKLRPSVRPGPRPRDPTKADEEWRKQFHLERAIAAVIDVSPDGKDLGVVAFTTGTEWFEDAAVARMPLEVFAARVRK